VGVEVEEVDVVELEVLLFLETDFDAVDEVEPKLKLNNELCVSADEDDGYVEVVGAEVGYDDIVLSSKSSTRDLWMFFLRFAKRVAGEDIVLFIINYCVFRFFSNNANTKKSYLLAIIVAWNKINKKYAFIKLAT